MKIINYRISLWTIVSIITRRSKNPEIPRRSKNSTEMTFIFEGKECEGIEKQKKNRHWKSHFKQNQSIIPNNQKQRWAFLYLQSDSTLTGSEIIEKSIRIYPCPKGPRLIFLLSPFRVRGKKAEKSGKTLICQSRTNSLYLKTLPNYYLLMQWYKKNWNLH